MNSSHTSVELVLKSACLCDFSWAEGSAWGVRIGLLPTMVHWRGKLCINWAKPPVSKILTLGYVSCTIGTPSHHLYGLYRSLRNTCFRAKIRLMFLSNSRISNITAEDLVYLLLPLSSSFNVFNDPFPLSSFVFRNKWKKKKKQPLLPRLIPWFSNLFTRICTRDILRRKVKHACVYVS